MIFLTLSTSSVSVSSLISPTISSIRSSMVRRPAVIPYSSRTIAMDLYLSLSSLISSDVFLVSKVKNGSRMYSVTLKGLLGLYFTSRSFAQMIPIMLSCDSWYTGILEYWSLRKMLISSSYVTVSSTQVMLMAGTITSLATVSPKSTTLLIISCSSCSMTPSWALASTIVRSSFSVICAPDFSGSIRSMNITAFASPDTKKVSGVNRIISRLMIGA